VASTLPSPKAGVFSSPRADQLTVKAIPTKSVIVRFVRIVIRVEKEPEYQDISGNGVEMFQDKF
jgi:hypothetical protein